MLKRVILYGCIGIFFATTVQAAFLGGIKNRWNTFWDGRSVDKYISKITKKRDASSPSNIVSINARSEQLFSKIKGQSKDFQDNFFDKAKEYRDEEGNTLLHKVAQNADFIGMDFFINHESRLQIEKVRNKQGRLYLQELPNTAELFNKMSSNEFVRNYKDIIKKLLYRDSYHLHNIDQEQKSLLHQAIAEKNDFLVDIILRPNKKYAKQKYTVLNDLPFSVQNILVKVVKKYNDTWQQTIRSKDAAALAAEVGGDEKAMRQLKAKIAKLDKQARGQDDVIQVVNGHSVLYEAVADNDFDLVEKIVTKKQNAYLILTPNYSTNITSSQKGYTPLDLAAKLYNEKMMLLLLKHAPNNDDLNISSIFYKRTLTQEKKDAFEAFHGSPPDFDRIQENFVHTLIKNFYKDVIQYIESKSTILDKVFEVLARDHGKYAKKLLQMPYNDIYALESIPYVKNKDDGFRYCFNLEQVQKVNEALSDKVLSFKSDLFVDEPVKKSVPLGSMKAYPNKKRR